MEAIVLAAGRGTRMQPLTSTTPKPLLPAGSEPLLGRVLRQVADAGVEDVTLVAGYRAEAVRDAVGDGSAWGLNVTTAVQDPPSGTGDALRVARKAGASGEVLVVNGDVVLPDGALGRVRDAGAWAVAAHPVDDPSRYGVLRVEDGAVREVVEKSPDPPGNLVNAGAYRLGADAWRYLEDVGASPRGEVELPDVLNQAANEGHSVAPVEVSEWLDVGYPWDLLEAAELLLPNLEPRVEGTVEDGVTLEGDVVVAEGAHLRSGTYVRGPAIIGPGCHLGPNCYVRAHTVLVGGNRVGHGVEVKNSVLLQGVTVGHLSYVGDSVLGRDVNLGAGTKVANLRHDGANVHAGKDRVDTGRRKFGVVLGEGVHTGINTSLNVGVMLPAGGSTLPGETVLESRF